MKKSTIPALIIASALSVAAYAQDAPVKKMGDILTNSAGMTLYTFDKDAAGSGKSVCNGPCATLWPPLMADAQASTSLPDYAIITRDDGGRQWTYKGKPLYLFSRDTQAGERSGENFKEIWHTVKLGQ